MHDHATYRIILRLNIGHLPDKRPFDIHDAERRGHARLADPVDDEGDGGWKDIVTEWPLGEKDEKIRFKTWWNIYALPLLVSGADMVVAIQDKVGETAPIKAGITLFSINGDPCCWVRVNREALAGDAGVALVKIKAVLEGKL